MKSLARSFVFAALAPALVAAPTVLAQRTRSASDLWTTSCANCHGADASGGGAGTPSLLSLDLFDQSHDRPFFDAIKNGVPDKGMEGFGETLTDSQVWALVVHIRELQAAALRKSERQRAAKPGAIIEHPDHSFEVKTLVESGLVTPWAVDWLPDGRMLITERAGRLRIHDGSTLSPPIPGVPVSFETGQGGMMDVAVHPEHADNAWIYLAYNAGADAKGPTMTRLVRGRLKTLGENGTLHWTEQETIFEAKPEHAIRSGVHFGCRIVFGPPVKDADKRARRHMYFSIGDRGSMDHAQDLSRPNGKVHRLWDDGAIPADNPFADDSKPRYPSIWSFGHRNPQGLCFDLDGNLWDTEHGPRGGDELNLIERGRNYGWPVVSFGINYSDAPFRTPWPDLNPDHASLTVAMPKDRWIPSIGACGLDCVRPGPKGEAFPNWRGNLLAGGLSGQNVDRIVLKDGAVVERHPLLRSARVRDVAIAPDGTIVVVLNGPDTIVRLTPAPPRTP